jgi:hypothetical protein
MTDVGDRRGLLSVFDDIRPQPANHQAAALESALVADLAAKVESAQRHCRMNDHRRHLLSICGAGPG